VSFKEGLNMNKMKSNIIERLKKIKERIRLWFVFRSRRYHGIILGLILDRLDKINEILKIHTEVLKTQNEVLKDFFKEEKKEKVRNGRMYQ